MLLWIYDHLIDIQADHKFLQDVSVSLQVMSFSYGHWSFRQSTC